MPVFPETDLKKTTKNPPHTHSHRLFCTVTSANKYVDGSQVDTFGFRVVTLEVTD